MNKLNNYVYKCMNNIHWLESEDGDIIKESSQKELLKDFSMCQQFIDEYEWHLYRLADEINEMLLLTDDIIEIYGKVKNDFRSYDAYTNSLMQLCIVYVLITSEDESIFDKLKDKIVTELETKNESVYCYINSNIECDRDIVDYVLSRVTDIEDDYRLKAIISLRETDETNNGHNTLEEKIGSIKVLKGIYLAKYITEHKLRGLKN